MRQNTRIERSFPPQKCKNNNLVKIDYLHLAAKQDYANIPKISMVQSIKSQLKFHSVIILNWMRGVI